MVAIASLDDNSGTPKCTLCVLLQQSVGIELEVQQNMRRPYLDWYLWCGQSGLMSPRSTPQVHPGSPGLKW